MNNIKIFSIIVAFFLFSSVNVFAQSGYQQSPLLTQQIDSGEVLIVADSTAALVPGVASVVPVVSNTAAMSSCSWYMTSCFKGTPPSVQCDCQFMGCSAGWTEGPCP